MKTFGFDYLMVATLADTRANNERQAQYFRELRREAELQERSRHAWKMRRQALRALLASVVPIDKATKPRRASCSAKSRLALPRPIAVSGS